MCKSLSIVLPLVLSLSPLARADAQQSQSEELVGTETNRLLSSAEVPAGRLAEHVIFDSTYRRPRRIWVYTPPRYRQRGTPYNLLVVFDGEDYFNAIPLPLILDTLLAARKAPPFVAVFVDDSIGRTRTDDLSNHSRFAHFVGRQLMPWVRKNWNVTRKAERTILAGFSNGGLAASYLAFKRTDLFGNVYSQSGSFWRGNEGAMAPAEWLTGQYAAEKKKDIRFALDVGDQETFPTGGSGPTIIDTNRRFRDALLSKGYSVSYVEVPGGGHDSVNWGSRFPDGLLALTRNWE